MSQDLITGMLIGGKLFKIQSLMWAKEVFMKEPRTSTRIGIEPNK